MKTIVFAEFADEGFKRALKGDAREDLIRRAVADRAQYMVEQVGRICPAFPDRRMFIDRPSAGALELRVLIEFKPDEVII